MPERLSALAAAYPVGRHGNPNVEPAVRLQELTGLSMVQLAWSAAGEEAVAAALATVAGAPATLPEASRGIQAGGVTLLWNGPRRILAVAAGVDLSTAVGSALAGTSGAAFVDLSQARSVVRLRGPGVRVLLAKGAPVDLHPAAAPAGSALSTRFNHFAVLLHLTGDDAVDVYVTRSFAQSFWTELLDLAAEQGYQVEPAG